MSLPQRVLDGDRRALARLITLVENEDVDARRSLTQLYRHTGCAHVIGVTGAPGTGKSSLVNKLALAYRRRDLTVGILAVDPSSPFSGGAILGDRIRMQELAGDRGIFIRSMASRGSLGGLAMATADAVKLLDAAGFEKIFVETVGAGQAEVDIARTAHSTIVVEVPGLGDDIQSIKAGILEIADVFAVNKADREGADSVALTLQSMLELNFGGGKTVFHHGVFMAQVALPLQDRAAGERWRPPICKVIAIQGAGIEELVDAIEGHWAFLRCSGRRLEKERLRVAAELETILRQAILSRIAARVQKSDLSSLIDRVVRREIDPYSAACELLEEASPKVD